MSLPMSLPMLLANAPCPRCPLPQHQPLLQTIPQTMPQTLAKPVPQTIPPNHPRPRTIHQNHINPPPSPKPAGVGVGLATWGGNPRADTRRNETHADDVHFFFTDERVTTPLCGCVGWGGAGWGQQLPQV